MKSILVIGLVRWTLAVSLAMSGILLGSSTPVFSQAPIYKCYEIEDSHDPSVTVEIEDQFFKRRVPVRRATHLCLPAKKDGKGDLSLPHLKCYIARDPRLPDKKMKLTTQFGVEENQKLTVPLERLCVPTLKSERPIPETEPVPDKPHYAAYGIRGSFRAEVDLETQFGLEKAVDVLNPAGLLAPAKKDGKGDLSLPHLKCFALMGGQSFFPPKVSHLKTQFGNERVSVTRATHLCVRAKKEITGKTEVDSFPNSQAQIVINTLFGSDTVILRGLTTVVVDIENLMDTDGDGLEQVPIEIVSMELTGTSALLGPITLRLRSEPPKDTLLPSFLPVLGEIEETTNNTPGVLDLFPFTDTGIAESFFDVFFEIEVPNLGLILHNDIPKRLRATVTSQPPARGETFQNLDVTPLLDEDENPTGAQIGATFLTLNPAPFIQAKLTTNRVGPNDNQIELDASESTGNIVSFTFDVIDKRTGIHVFGPVTTLANMVTTPPLPEGDYICSVTITTVDGQTETAERSEHIDR